MFTMYVFVDPSLSLSGECCDPNPHGHGELRSLARVGTHSHRTWNLSTTSGPACRACGDASYLYS
jgi:hypothetical protein